MSPKDQRIGSSGWGRRRPPSEAGRTRPRWSCPTRYANEAVLPFYLLHETVIVYVAWAVVRWDAFVPVKYLTIVAVSFAATLTLYELLIRRFRVMRWLFGMKPAHAPAGGRQAGRAVASARPAPAARRWVKRSRCYR